MTVIDTADIGGITLGSALILIYIFVTFFFFINKAKKNPESIKIRKIPGIDAIDEAIGRAAELGRPVSFSTGLTGIGPVLYAALGALSHVAKKTARYSVNLILPQNQPDVLVICDDLVRDVYKAEDKESAWDSSNSKFLSDEQLAYAAGYMGIIDCENVGSAFLFGTFAGEALILAEAGQRVGAMQVAASVTPEQVAFFVTTCDYTLIGEEIYAISAYITKEPIQLGTLAAQDYIKLFLAILIIVGVIYQTIKIIFPSLFVLPSGNEIIEIFSNSIVSLFS